MRRFGCCLQHLVWIFLVLHFVCCTSFPAPEVSALTAFREAIYEDPFTFMSDWNTLDEDPCKWNGILCSSSGLIDKINISGVSLRGFLAPELGELSSLTELILHGNNLIGTIPREIGKLKNLMVLDIGSNQLSGPIPSAIGNLTSVVKIDLHSNGLTGSLPAELGNLQNLQKLLLDRNKLQGTVPASSFPSDMYGMNSPSTWKNLTGICGLTKLTFADFSYNFLTGSIPKCLEHLPRSSFQGNCLEDKDLKPRPASRCGVAPLAKSHPGDDMKQRPADEVSKSRGASKPAWLMALEIVTGTMVGCLVVVAVLTAVHRCKTRSSIIIPWKKSASQKDNIAVYVERDSEILKDVTRFSRQDLEVACEDFSNIIGSSPDSLVYKGNLKGGPEIAVISLCIKEENWTGYLELYYQKEVADLARINHENTGKLLGYCRESTPFTRMLVFEYASNGTLCEHLHYGDGCQFSWTRRMKIIIGIARGLRYLHSELDPPFTISELNSSAVYLTDDFSPKLVDFESWKTILARSEKNSGSIGMQGSICVLPNSIEMRHLDVRGNVFAFGVLLLEIISGRPPYSEDKGSLVKWAETYLEIPEVMSYIVDPEIKNFKYEDLKVVCQVVNLCINPDASNRPLMDELCSMLESGINTSVSADFQASSLAWAELALSS